MLRLGVRLAHFDDEQAASRLTWPNSGFQVHTTGRISEDDGAFARSERDRPPMGGALAADPRGRPARMSAVTWPQADRGAHHARVSDRSDPDPPPIHLGALAATGARLGARSPPSTPARATPATPAATPASSGAARRPPVRAAIHIFAPPRLAAPRGVLPHTSTTPIEFPIPYTSNET